MGYISLSSCKGLIYAFLARERLPVNIVDDDDDDDEDEDEDAA